MEVDAIEINIAATETKKPKVQCYFCSNEGHIKKDCHKLKALIEKGEDPLPKKANL
jgi:hypothetical protein